MWIAPDALMYASENSYRTWFFFSVTGLPAKARTIRFTLKNMSNQQKLINYGHKPVMIELSGEEHLKMTKENQAMYS